MATANNSEVHLPTQVLGRTPSPLKSLSQSRGCEATAEAVLQRLTRLAMSRTHHTPLPRHDVTSPLTPEGPLVLPVPGARCTACPRSRRLVQPDVITSRGPVHTIHQSLWKEPLSPLKGTPLATSGGRLHTVHIAYGDALPSVRRCKWTTTAEARRHNGKGMHDYDAIPQQRCDSMITERFLDTDSIPRQGSDSTIVTRFSETVTMRAMAITKQY